MQLIQNSLSVYEEAIKKVINLFEEKFHVPNPLSMWRNGFIERVGYLDSDNNIEYSLHGAGCTIVLKDDTIISFDFGTSDNYTFDVFKFKVFVETSPLLIENRDFILSEIESGKLTVRW